jgi:hypothetical protein
MLNDYQAKHEEEYKKGYKEVPLYYHIEWKDRKKYLKDSQ